MATDAGVRLRPVTQEDIPLLDSWDNSVEAQGAYNSFGLVPATGHGRRFAEHGMLSEAHGTLMIIAPDGERVGTVSYRQVRYGPNIGSLSYEIGINIIATQRGRGYGPVAQRLIAEYLFDTYPVARIQAATDITNIPEQRALERAGFTREGVLRKAQWRAGEQHDLVMYSKLRGE